MKYARIIGPLVIAFSATVFAAGNSDALPDRDGKWWITITPLEKAIYTLGLMDGTEIGGALLSPTESAEMPDFALRSKQFFGQVNVKQLVDGMDHFYKDFRNREIGTRDALVVVTWQIKGTRDDAWLEAFVRKLRQLSHP